MNNVEKYKIDINVLSPIHVGNGISYYPNEYIIENKSIRRINIIKLYKDLSPSEKKVFLEALQDENFMLNNPEFNSICDNVNLKDKFTHDKLKKYNKCIINKEWDEPPKPNKEINESIKSGNRYYIPGSSLKGAIKTAIFYNIVQENDIPQLISYIKNKDYDEPINHYFSSKIAENPSQGSIMRFFNVVDSDAGDGIIFEIMAYTAKKNKLEKSKYQKVYLECISNKLRKNLSSEIRFNFNEKFYSALDLKETADNYLNIDNIKKFLYQFSNDIIKHERKFWENTNEFDKIRNDVLEFYDNLPLDEDKPLIRLGSGSGFHNKTIYLKIKEYDDNHGTRYLKDVEKHIDSSRKIKFPKNNFPKTRRITNVDNMPLGWAQLEFKKLN